MRYGCCVGLEGMDAAADAGFDFVELPISVLLPEKPEADFTPVRDRLLASRIKPEAWRFDLPAEVKVTGAAVDWPRLARYAYTALRRAAEVGGAVAGFCSGPSRHVPKGFPGDEAMRQLSEFLRICGAAARSQGVMVAIEPLGAEYCNIVNSLPEAVSLARQVNMSEVGVLPNISHMIAEGQSLLDMVDAAAWLAHVHICADLVSSPQEETVVAELVGALRMADYDWRISITDQRKDRASDLRPFLESLRGWFEAKNGES